MAHIHDKKIKMDRARSKKSLGRYLEQFDFAKLFFTQKDIKILEKLSDDRKGLMGKIFIIIGERIDLLSHYQKTFFKNNFIFSDQKGSLKTKYFPKNVKELKGRWRKVLQEQVMRQYSLISLESKKTSSQNKEKALSVLDQLYEKFWERLREKPLESFEYHVGMLLKSYVENLHYQKLVIDDKLSGKAFYEYLKKIDFSKLFLTQGDVRSLKKYLFKFDDQIISGNVLIATEVFHTIRERVNILEKYQRKIFKKPFLFKAEETLEIDPKKRDFAKDVGELKERWRKLLKQQTMNQYISFLEEKEDYFSPEKKKKDEKKKKTQLKDKEKPIHLLSDQEMREKSHAMIGRQYKYFWLRLKQKKRNDYIIKFFNSLLGIFDPHTVYLPPRVLEDSNILIHGSLEGIGAVLQEHEGYIKVVKVPYGGAAWKQKKLEPGDLLLSVENEGKKVVDIVGMRVGDAVGYIRGKKGTKIILKVKKASGKIEFITITRDIIQIEETFAKSSLLKHKSLPTKIGYILLPSFYRNSQQAKVNSTNDVRKELIRLKEEGADGIILDLRNNSGGVLQDAQMISGLFIKSGPIVQVKRQHGEVDILEDKDDRITYDGPLIVMINEFSASASEIVAGALQDYRRAVIVGGKYSHGKGSVQAIVSLNNHNLFQALFQQAIDKNSLGALKLTIQKFYRITGSSTQFKGVVPDISLPDFSSYLNVREEKQSYALPWDQIKGQKYSIWKDAHLYDYNYLRTQSAARIAKNSKIQNLIKNIAFVKKRKDETLISLNFAEQRKKNKERKRMLKSFENDDENSKLSISLFEPSLLEHRTILKQDQEKWSENFKKKQEEWFSILQKDYLLEETLFILNDMIVMQSKR